MIDWTYTEDCLPPVRADFRCFEATLPKRFRASACAPVLFCVAGDAMPHAGFYFAGNGLFVSTLGRLYAMQIVYAWAPAPAAALERRTA